MVMPGQTARSSLFGKFAPRINKGIADHREDELDLGGFGPPPGINGGTAQVTGCKFGTIAQGKQNAGAPYFMLEAVIIDPVEHTFTDPPGSRPKTVTTEGVQVRQMINMTDSPNAGRYKTVEDKVGQVLNELRKLGVDTTSLGNDHELLAAVAMITESRPLVRFRTWKGKPTEQYPDPRVNVSFEGLADEMPVGGEGDGMDDATGGPPDNDDSGDDDGSGGDDDETEKAKQGANGQATTPGKKGTPVVKGKTGTRSIAAVTSPVKEFDETASAPDAPSDDEAEEEPGDDLDALVREATAGSDDAQQRLSELAAGAGISEQDMQGMVSWEEVANAVSDGGSGGEEIEEPEPPPAARPATRSTAAKSGKASAPRTSAATPAAATSTPVKSGTASSPVPKDEQVYMYKPMVRNPRTKKDEPSAKAVECLVIRVHPTTKTVDLKNLEDGKNTYKGVPWGALEGR